MDAHPPTHASSRIAITIATGFGVGHLPRAPGTWGSLLGVGIYLLVYRGLAASSERPGGALPDLAFLLAVHIVLAALAAGAGVWASGRAALRFGRSDPQPVVIDEVSGQLIALLGAAPFAWRYVLACFVLFRLFDIWKPFPVRQAEALPGGWGIMADDWAAGGYAVLVVWGIRLVGW